MEFLVAALIVVLLVRWIVLSRRLGEIERQLQHDALERDARARTIHELMSRIGDLERGAATKPPLVPRVSTPIPMDVPIPVPIVFTEPAPEPPIRVVTPPPLPPVLIPIAVEPEPVPVIPRESLRDRIRKQVGDEGWEAMVGGSWLNKLGVLVLVIGIALLLGYSFTRVGPAGRVSIGFGIGLTMLIGGVVIERRPAYAIFARGLIGGGWAALYFTTYAMYGVEAAKIIDSAFVGSVLLLAVAAGMIGHSLRYRSQTVSGLAFFIAFATLALSENTPFSVIALVPLAAALLYLAYRFDWYKMAVFGLFATYATCASRPDVGAPLGSTQALFASYWLLFEAFDLLRLRRRPRGFSVESLILPLNSLGFLSLSLVKWHRAAPEHVWAALAAGSAVYLASALLRASITPPNLEENTFDRIAAGGYEGPIAISAVMAAVSVYKRASGIWIDAGWLIEGEVLFLAGVRFGQTYLRQLAAGVFSAAVLKILTVDTNHPETRWTPVAGITAVVFYVNRAFRVVEGSVYSSAAALLIVVGLGYETPQPFLCVAWLIYTAVLFEFGLRVEKPEFLFQSYAVAALGTGAGLMLNTLQGVGTWLPLAIAGAIHYAISLRGRASERVPEVFKWFTSASAAAFLMTLAWRYAPPDYRGLAWLALGGLLFELGLQKVPEHLRRISYIASLAGFGHLFYFHILRAQKGSPPAESWSLGIGVLICYALSARVFRSMPDRIPEPERVSVRDWNAAAGTMFIMMLTWLQLPAPVVAVAWAIVSLLLLEIGFAFSVTRFRWIGNLVSAAVVGRLFLANFTDLGNTTHISHRLLTVAPIILSQYYVWSRYRNAPVESWERNWVRLYLYAPTILAVVLARFELGRSLAVVGWALIGLAVYRAGLVYKIADLRWQSYPIALLTFWRCWNTNFYIPESLAGIRGRILTGAFVVATFYCAQLISPRETRDDVRSRLDRYARTFYSLLASTLLAVLLFYEVSGGMLTMALGVEALALLGAGFPLRDRVQRLSGLLLFLVCILKLFLYDLRQLETINRILSFIVLGVILVSVSWIYTRFRDRIQRYL